MSEIKKEYQFPVYLFHKGENYRAYEFFGVHRIKGDTFAFRVWAPNAQAVSLVGDFNSWNYEANYMIPIAPGIWECIKSGVHIYDCYKYAIRTKDGRTLEKADPYGFHCETRPGTASKVYEIDKYKWTDKKWIDGKKSKNMLEQPVNIYEIHFGSWKRHENGDFLSYREMADALIPYVKDMGYTHIEMMPVMFALSHITVFIERFAVKFIKTAGIFRKVGWNPVKYNTYSGLMALINEIHQILRFAVS